MTTRDVFTRYETSLAQGDMAELAATLHPEVVWHQPGTHPLSGDHHGPDAVLALLGGLMRLSAGSLRITTTATMVNADHVATTVAFTASRPGRADLAQNGVDVFRIAEDTIAEIWLFSDDQAAEDAFWA